MLSADGSNQDLINLPATFYLNDILLRQARSSQAILSSTLSECTKTRLVSRVSGKATSKAYQSSSPIISEMVFSISSCTSTRCARS
jgi:hypothetical protein